MHNMQGAIPSVGAISQGRQVPQNEVPAACCYGYPPRVPCYPNCAITFPSFYFSVTVYFIVILVLVL